MIWDLLPGYTIFSTQIPMPSTARWGWFNQTCKRHEKDYHGIVVHTLGDHNPLSLKSYKFKINLIKEIYKARFPLFCSAP